MLKTKGLPAIHRLIAFYSKLNPRHNLPVARRIEDRSRIDISKPAGQQAQPIVSRGRQSIGRRGLVHACAIKDVEELGADLKIMFSRIRKIRPKLADSLGVRA
jgi:hypothetical protein